MPSRHLKYVHELEAGPKTTRDMVLSLMVTGASVARMMQKLRTVNVVKSERVIGGRGNVWRHELIPGYEAILEARSRIPLSKELMFIADLSDRSYVGQRLDAEHAKHFPARSRDSMRHLVDVARGRGMCR
jgi:hypothetical protein